MSHKLRKRLKLIISQRVDDVGHRGNAAASAGSGLEIPQGFQQIVFAPMSDLDVLRVRTGHQQQRGASAAESCPDQHFADLSAIFIVNVCVSNVDFHEGELIMQCISKQ